MIKEFVKQDIINERSLGYNAGKVCANNNEYIIGYNQQGAEDTFSISQPVYDKDGNKIGYLGIGTYRSLDYAHHPHDEDVPCYYWKICNPTKYCEQGKQIYTYWQNFNEFEKSSYKVK